MTLLIILAFFTGFRIIKMIQYDYGPFDVFDKFRSWIESLKFKFGTRTKIGKIVHTFDEGFNCPVCLSVWIFGLISLGFLITGINLFESILIWLGLSGIYYLTVTKGWL